MNDHVLSASPTLDDQTRACLRLWSAVLLEGIRSAAVGFSRHDMEHEAVRWLYEEGDTVVRHYYGAGQYQDIRVRDTPGSFTWICHLMGFDADQARSKVRMNARKLARQVKAVEKESSDVPVES